MNEYGNTSRAALGGSCPQNKRIVGGSGHTATVASILYGYPLLAPTDSVSGVEIAGLMDVGLMKLDALMGRGMRKDFYDVYFVAPHVPLDELVAHWETKYSYSRGVRMRLLTALVDFSIADQQQDPILLAPVSWGQVKAFCEAEARRLSNLWFAQSDSERS